MTGKLLIIKNFETQPEKDKKFYTPLPVTKTLQRYGESGKPFEKLKIIRKTQTQILMFDALRRFISRFYRVTQRL